MRCSGKFKAILEESGVKIILIPVQAPNANALAERFVLSVKTECLNKMIFFGVGSLDRALLEYRTHYLLERPHQGLGNELIHGTPSHGGGDDIVTERLGGHRKFYSRVA